MKFAKDFIAPPLAQILCPIPRRCISAKSAGIGSVKEIQPTELMKTRFGVRFAYKMRNLPQNEQKGRFKTWQEI